MPVVSSQVVEESATQADGRKYLRFEFTLSSGEVLTHFGYGKYPGGTDAETQRAALIPDVNAYVKQRELEFAWGYGASGGNIDTYPWVENTLAEVRTYWWRRFMNLFASEGNGSTEERLRIAVEAAPYYNLPSSPQIAGYLNAGWTTQMVNGAMNGIAAIAVNVPNMTHDNGEIV